MKTNQWIDLKRVLVVGILFLMSGCGAEHDPIEPLERPGGGGGGANREVPSFENVFQAVIKPKCSDGACHGGRESPMLTSYKEVFNQRKAIHEAIWVKKDMPKNNVLDDTESKLLWVWLQEGAPLNGSKPDKPPVVVDPDPKDPPGLKRPVVWSVVLEKVLKPQCIACHNGIDGTLNLGDYQVAKSKANDFIFYTMLTKSRTLWMPPPDDADPDGVNRNELSKELKEIISLWVIDGALEN